MPAQVIAPALAAGNTVVWAPAPSTSVCSAVLVDAIADAGLPPGTVAFLPGPGAVVGDEIAGHPGVAAVAFVGSTKTGLSVARRAAGKARLLEMGNNGPLVVMDDADLHRAVAGTIAGPTCAQGRAAQPPSGSWSTSGSTTRSWRRWLPRSARRLRWATRSARGPQWGR
jgi:acyl-CoA reductase-like NAD-dependent aldehyde dehydrogenase